MARLGLQCDKGFEGLYVLMYVPMHISLYVHMDQKVCMYVCILVTGIYKLETATGIVIRTAL